MGGVGEHDTIVFGGGESKGGRILLVVALCSVDVYIGTIILL